MVSTRSVLAAGSLAAFLSVGILAQSTSSPAQPSQAQPTAPAAGSTTNSAPRLQLQDLPPDPHTLTPAEQAEAREQQAMAAALRLASLQAHWGPEMSTPGLSIAMSELARTKTADGTQIRYQITGSGFAPTDKLMLVRWPLDGQAKVLMGGINFDTKGVAVCSDTTAAQPAGAATAAGTTAAETAQAAAPASNLSAAPTPNQTTSPAPAFAPPPSCAATMKPGQPVEIETTAAAGEAIRVALVTADRKQAAEASAVPFPIENADKGCKLQVILSLKDAGLVLLDGTGFPPNTPLKLVADTGSGTRELHPRSNAQGRVVVPVLTTEKGKASGTTTVKFAGIHHEPTLDTAREAATPDPDCAPSVSYPWGEGSYKPE